MAGSSRWTHPSSRSTAGILNPFLSPAAVERWDPFIDDFTRACIDDVIETGRLDFVDDFANIVPAVLTMAMLGLPLADWEIYCEPAHMQVYTAPDSPNFDRMLETTSRMVERLAEYVQIRKTEPRPGMITAAPERQGDGRVPARRGHHRHRHAAHRRRLRHHARRCSPARSTGSTRGPTSDRGWSTTPTTSISATEEFLRHFTPAQGGGRTVTQDCEVEGFEFAAGDRMFLSYAMCNHDPASFPDPDEIVLDRFPNPHAAFGLGVHRCIGSNLARLDFKYMLREALRRMPDYRIDHAGKEQYESIGTINGYKHLPATFTPGRREGPPLRRGDGRLAGAARRRARAREPARGRGRSLMARVIVNADLCQGHTLCNMAAPDDLPPARRGRPRLRRRRRARRRSRSPLARQAELGCPERAITVEE